MLSFDLLQPFLKSPAIRIVGFFLVWILVWLPIAIPLSIRLKWRPGLPLAVNQKLPLLLSLYLLAPLVVWLAIEVEGVSWAQYGLPWNGSVLVSLGIGILGAILSLVILFGVQWGLGWLSWQQDVKVSWWEIVLPTLGIGLVVGLIEELIFRGFLLNQLHQIVPGWLAALVSAVIFALLHLVWEGRENLPQLPGLCLMGIVLVLARWVDQGQLGLAWGLHTGWILGIASLDTAQVLLYPDRKKDWLTGLDQKPLAGLLGVMLMAAVGLILGFLLPKSLLV